MLVLVSANFMKMKRVHYVFLAIPFGLIKCFENQECGLTPRAADTASPWGNVGGFEEV